MWKSLQTIAMLIALVVLMTSCAAQGKEEPAPTPTVPAETTHAAEQTPAPQASPEADVYKLVGESAQITVGATQIYGSAYYAGDGQETMVFPLAEVAKALGWTVDDSDIPGPVEMKLTRDGAEEVVIQYTRPKTDTLGHVEGLSATKGGREVALGKDAMPFLDGMLYATEHFIDVALQEIDVKYDDATTITIDAVA